MKFIKLLWAIISLLGNIVQIYWISSTYFKYDVATNVHVFMPEYFDAPSLTICLDAWKLLDWPTIMKNDSLKEFFLRFPPKLISNYGVGWFLRKQKIKAFRSTTDKSGEEYISLNQFNQILQNFSKFGDKSVGYPLDQVLVRQIDRLATDSSSRNVPLLFDLTKNTVNQSTAVAVKLFCQKGLTGKNATDFVVQRSKNKACIKMSSFFLWRSWLVGGHHKCLTLNPVGSCGKNVSYFTIRNNRNPILSMRLLRAEHLGRPSRRENPYDIELREWGMFSLPIGKPNVAINRPDERFYTYTTPYLEVPNEFRQAAIHVTYNEYRNILLPSPYETNCRDYKREGLTSQENCFESCLVSQYVKSVGSLYNDMPLYDNDDGVTWDTSRDMIKRRANYAKKKTLVAQCLQECRQKDCSNVVYIPIVQSVTDGLVSNNFYLDMSPNPVIRAETIEQVTLIQYLTDAGSSLGFWFGMSVVGIAEIMRGLVSKMMRKNNQKTRIFNRVIPSGEQPKEQRYEIREIRQLKSMNDGLIERLDSTDQSVAELAQALKTHICQFDVMSKGYKR